MSRDANEPSNVIEKRLRLIIDTIPAIVWRKDPDGSADFLNRNFREYTGLSLDQGLGWGWMNAFHPDDRLIEEWCAALAAEKPFEKEARLRRADGQYRWFLIRTVPLRDEQGKVVKWYGTSNDIEDLKRAEQELRRLTGEILRLQDEERRRIARDLHDSTGQDLVALTTYLSELRGSIPPSSRKLRKLASQCKALANHCIREVRTLSYLLHPPMLDEAGLEDAIRHYVGGFTKRTGIVVELEISPRLGRMDPHVELALFRVVQESLTNIQRHSGSPQAKIRIERAPGKVTLEISDKGSGISGGLRRRNGKIPFVLGVGIPSMRQRLTAIGGQLDIESSSGGTTVRVTIPADD